MGQRAGRLALVLLVVLAVGAGVDALGDATQVRPERPVPGTSTHVVVTVLTRTEAIDRSAMARLLVEQCEARLHRPVYQVGIAARLDDQDFLVRTTPALGRYSTQRFRGCLEDLNLDFVLGRVKSVRHLPAG